MSIILSLRNNLVNKAKRLYFKETPHWIEWAIVAVLSFIMLISFFYIDTQSLTAWSFDLLDAVAEGRIKDFYLLSYINEYGAHSSIFYGPFYQLIPWAIWNIPIWLIQKLTGIAIISNPFIMVWSKLFLVVLEGVVLLFSYKITVLTTKKSNKGLWVVFLSASFPFMLIGVYYSGQSDILVIALSVITVYALLRKKNKSFLLWSMLAISMKPFFLFPFVLLVLLTEKNILKILLKIFIGYAPTIIFQVLFADAPMFQAATELAPAGENLEMLTRTSFGRVLMTNGSWFFLLFVVLCVVAYITKAEDEPMYNKYVIYFTSAAYFLVMGFTSIQHYRPIYFAPFLFILIMLNEDWFRINIILKTFYSFTTLFALCLGSENIFARDNIKNTLITAIFKLDSKACSNMSEFLTKSIVEYETYHKIFASVSVACIVILLVINYPRFKVKPQIDCTKCERWIIWIDLVVMCGMLFGVFKLFFKGFAFM